MHVQVPPDAPTKIDLCALLAKEDVEAVIGKLDEPPKPSVVSADHGGCEWNAHLDRKIAGLVVALFDFKSTAASWETGKPVEVPGVKRAATTAATSLVSGGALLLELEKPPYVVQIMVDIVEGGAPRANIEKELAIAKLLVPRIVAP